MCKFIKNEIIHLAILKHSELFIAETFTALTPRTCHLVVINLHLKGQRLLIIHTSPRQGVGADNMMTFIWNVRIRCRIRTDCA